MPRKRVRELGLALGPLSPGPWNAITDVSGVRIGHVTLMEGQGVRTGVTAILPHGGNLFQDRVPAGIAVGNGFGKLIGFSQVEELGEIETPIILTNTLAAPRAAEALLEWTLSRPGNEQVTSVNPVVGETNDGLLNDIRKIAVTKRDVIQALENASSGPIEEGCVGAGTGTVCLGWKGGIGTSSRALPVEHGEHTLGVLVQTNFGGVLRMDATAESSLASSSPDGSIMIVIATDAPLSDRNLRRLARRGLAGMARAGASMSDGSGDYAIAFSTAEDVRRTSARRSTVSDYPEVPNARMSPLFQAAMDATEEAIYNSLCMAVTMTGFEGKTVQAIPLARLIGNRRS